MLFHVTGSKRVGIERACSSTWMQNSEAQKSSMTMKGVRIHKCIDNRR